MIFLDDEHNARDLIYNEREFCRADGVQFST